MTISFAIIPTPRVRQVRSARVEPGPDVRPKALKSLDFNCVIWMYGITILFVESAILTVILSTALAI
jgi:hypothetical protein